MSEIIMPSPTDKPESSAQREIRTLRDYVHLLADAIDKSPMPFVAGYPDGRTMAFNEAFTKLTGYNEEELRNMQWVLYLTPPEWQEQEAKAMEDLRRTGQPQHYEKEQASNNGSRTPVSVVLSQIMDREGKVQFYYALLTDRTEMKRAEALEKEVQEMKEKEQALMGATFEGVAVVREGNIMGANEHLAEIAGYTTAEMNGLPESALLTPGLRGLASSQLSGPSGTSEAMINHKDGHTVPVEVHVQDVVSHGTPTRVLRIRDISERVRYQADKEQLLRQLAEVSEELSGLKQVSSISVNVAQPDLAMDSLVRQMAMITGADSGVVMERNGDRLAPRSVYGMGDKLPPGYTEDIGSLFPGKLVTTNQDLHIEDVQVDTEVSEVLKATGARTLMGVPIRNGGNIIGVLFLGWGAPRPINDREMGLMEIVADRCASVIMSSNVNEQTRANEDFGSMLSEINNELNTTLKLGMSKFQ